MSTWKELCAAYERLRDPDDYGAIIKFRSITRNEFDKLRAVVEAAETWRKYCDEELGPDKSELTALRKALKNLGAIE